MRSLPPALAGILLLVLLAPAATAQNQPPQVDSVFPQLDQVDIVNDAGEAIWLRVTARDDVSVVHVSAEFVRQPPCAPESFIVDFSPVQDAKRVIQAATSTLPEVSEWNHNFSIDDRRLTTCDWRLFFRAHDEQGRIDVQPVDDDGPEYVVQVEADVGYDGTAACPGAVTAAQPPSLCLVGVGAVADRTVPTRVVNPQVRLRAGEVLTFNLTMFAPQRMTFEQRMGPGAFVDEQDFGGAAVEEGLNHLPHSALVQGTQELIVRAYPRILTEPTLTIHLKNLSVDREAPLAAQPRVPDEVYRDIEFPLEVDVVDSNPNSIRVTIEHRAGAAAPQEMWQSSSLTETTYKWNVTLDRNGPYLVSVRVTDSHNNRHLSFHNLTVVSPYTKLIAGAIQPLNETPLPGDKVGFRVPVTQSEGVLPVDVRVSFAAAQRVDNQTVEVGPDNTTHVKHERVYPPGQHTLDVTVVPPSLWQVLDGSRLTRSLEFEVFLGAVVDGSTTYWIRANERGLPGSAVLNPGARNERVHDLESAQNGTRAVYSFEVEGRALTWDPFQHNAKGQSVTTVGPTPAPETPDRDSPAPALLLALLALAAVALARRRGGRGGQGGSDASSSPA